MSDYNGWTNYETWNVNLWVGNDEGLDNEKMRVLRRSHEVSAKTVREFFAEVMGGTTPDLDSLQEIRLLFRGSPGFSYEWRATAKPLTPSTSTRSPSIGKTSA